MPQIADEFLRQFKIKVEALKLGNPMDDATQIGPMATVIRAASETRFGLRARVVKARDT